MRDGFEADHVPVVKLPRVVKAGEMLVNLWSTKTVTPYIRQRGLLYLAAMANFETNPEVLRISSYPIEFPYATYDKHGFPKERRHRPALGLLMCPRAGSKRPRRVYIDVIRKREQEKYKWIATRTADLKRAFAEQMDAVYNVLDEDSLNIKPMFWNTQVVAYHSDDRDEDAKFKVRKAMQHLPEVTTIAEIKDVVGEEESSFDFVQPDGVVTYSIPLEDNRVFRAVLSMYARGELAIDTSETISEETAVWWNADAGAFG